MTDLDPFEIKILRELQRDANQTTAEIAERVGLSVSPCWRRIDRLERDGFIYRVPGKGCYVAEKNMELVREEHLKRIEQHMREIVALAVPCGMDEAETARMLELIWSEEENSDERN